jgi:type I restriction enzyme M protein
MLDNETKRRIDTARDILVGKVPDPKSQVEQITIALVYKFMDDMDKESVGMGGKAGFFTGDHKRYAWSKIFDPRLGGHEMLALYGEAIVKLNQNPNIPQLFRDIFKNAYLPYRDPETLKLFLKTINEFHYDHSERLGDAFEYLLSVLGSQGDAGQFRTPRHIIDFMVQVVNPQKHETILDPACGTAGFLISSYKHILKENTRKTPGDRLTGEERKRLLTNFKGYDISPDMVRLSLVNLYLHGFVQPNILEYDTLTSEDRWNEYADVIMANPPFMSPKGGIKPHKKFSVQSNRSEVLFVDYIAEHLTPAGRAAVIVPEGIIFQSANAYKKLRKMLVENHLYAVVSLPAGIFNPYSGVKTSILLMDRQIARKCDSILFVKIANDGFGLGAQRREQSGSDLPDAVKGIADYVKAVRSGFPDAFKPEENPCGALLVNKEKLAENEEYNLTGDRYRIIEKRGNQKWPMVRLGDVCDVVSGQSPEGKYYNNHGKGTPFYQGKTEFSERYIGSPSKWTTQETKIAEKDDILISVRAPVGPVNISTQRICIGRGLAGIRVSEKILGTYLFTFLKINEKNIKGNGGAVFDSINRKDIEAILLPLPSLEVQREIVTEIEAYQKLIDGARQVVESWKPRIEIDPEWPLNLLKELADIKTGKIDVNQAEENGMYPFFTCAKEPYRINEFAFDCEALLLAGNNATADYDVKYYKGKFNAYQRTYIITIPNDLISYPYLQIIMESKLGHLKRNSIGSQTKYLTLGVIQSVQIPLPPLKVQQEIVAKIEAERKIVDGCRELIKTYEDKIKQVIDKVWEE